MSPGQVIVCLRCESQGPLCINPQTGSLSIDDSCWKDEQCESQQCYRYNYLPLESLRWCVCNETTNAGCDEETKTRCATVTAEGKILVVVDPRARSARRTLSVGIHAETNNVLGQRWKNK